MPERRRHTASESTGQRCVKQIAKTCVGSRNDSLANAIARAGPNAVFKSEQQTVRHQIVGVTVIAARADDANHRQHEPAWGCFRESLFLRRVVCHARTAECVAYH